MKHLAIVAVTGLSFLLAIPVSNQPVKQQIHLSYKPVATKVVTQAAIKQTPPPVQPVTTPPPTPVVTPIVYANGCSNYNASFRQYNWSVTTAEAICQAESGGNVYAVSPTNDYGLMQLHDKAIFNPYDNIAAAYQIYLTQGWEAWTTYTSGKYLQYL